MTEALRAAYPLAIHRVHDLARGRTRPTGSGVHFLMERERDERAQVLGPLPCGHTVEPRETLVFAYKPGKLTVYCWRCIEGLMG
jgi:hypothetical protein